MTEAISVTGLAKSFGRARALDGLDLHVETGEVHGFLGPNGAGKTTTIRTLLGGNPWTDATELHKRLAYVPGDVTLWPGLTGGEVIDLLGRLRGGVDPRRRAELLDRFDLDPRKKARTYSKGNRQKVALVAAFATDVELLILDEPTSGLDPLMEEVFREVVREQRRTVLLSSHILGEVEALCDRVTIIREGRTVESGSLAELRHLTRTSINAELTGPADGLATLPGVHDLRDDRHGHVTFDVDTEALEPALKQLVGVGVRSLTSQPPTLEELFLRKYQKEQAR
jgi:ABC-2 type transport system ATP-binding protein